VVTSIPIVTGVLDQYAVPLGRDFIPYRNSIGASSNSPAWIRGHPLTPLPMIKL